MISRELMFTRAAAFKQKSCVACAHRAFLLTRFTVSLLCEDGDLPSVQRSHFSFILVFMQGNHGPRLLEVVERRPPVVEGRFITFLPRLLNSLSQRCVFPNMLTIFTFISSSFKNETPLLHHPQYSFLAPSTYAVLRHKHGEEFPL